MFIIALDVVIPTSSADKQNIILKEGQKVMVLKSPKGIYMQLETGKIIAIRTALKVGHNKDKAQQDTPFMAREMQQKRSPATMSGTNKVVPISTVPTATATAPATTATATAANSNTPANAKNARGRGANHVQFGRNKTVQMGTAKPYTTVPTPENASMLGQCYPMSNSTNSSFDADISDDSQFLEKLGEDNADDSTKHLNKPIENKCVEPNEQQQQHQLHQPHQPLHAPMLKNQPQNNSTAMQSHHINTNKVNNNGGGDSMATLNNDKSNNMTHTHAHTQMTANKPEHMNRQSYSNANIGSSGGGGAPPPSVDTYNSNMNNSNGNYNYGNYNAPQNNIGYNDVQSTPNAPSGQSSQMNVHQPNVMNQTRQSDKYSAATQHVS